MPETRNGSRNEGECAGVGVARLAVSELRTWSLIFFLFVCVFACGFVRATMCFCAYVCFYACVSVVLFLSLLVCSLLCECEFVVCAMLV